MDMLKIAVRPHFKHDCDKCEFLGRNDTLNRDFYYCDGESGVTLIIRHSHEPSDYASFSLHLARHIARGGGEWTEAIYLYDNREVVPDEEPFG